MVPVYHDKSSCALTYIIQEAKADFGVNPTTMAYTILVPLDGSHIGEKALVYARDLAREKKGELMLLRCSTAPASGWMGAELFLPPPARDRESPQIKDYLHELTRELTAEGIAVRSSACTGDAAEAIVREAERADLVVMTSRGRSGLGHWLLGSVAEQVVRGAPCPVLVVGGQSLEDGPEGLPGFRRILVPLDGSLNSERALGHAAEMARLTGAGLYLLRALVTPDQDHSLPTTAAAHHAEKQMVDEYLRERAASLTGLEVHCRTIAGPAARAITLEVEREKIDLIVMSTHGRTGWNRWVCGSVAESVLRAATCPVLLVSTRNHAVEMAS